jgi:hypothetical protein
MLAGVMWPWRARVELTERGLKVGSFAFSFEDLSDASLDGAMLRLVTTSGREWQGRVRGGLPMLEAILDGIDSAHPAGGTIYRTPGAHDPEPDHHFKRHLRRRSAQGASPDLWIGRTLYK